MDLASLEPHQIIKYYLERSPKYSLRGLARDLRISAPFLSSVLNGKKPVPLRHVESCIELLDIDFESATLLKQKMNAFPSNFRPEGGVNQSMFEHLEESEAELLEKWYHFPMSELCTLPSPPEELHTALGITEYEAEYSVNLLLRLGLIKEGKDGKYFKTKSGIRYSSSHSQKLIRKFHMTMMDKAKGLLVEQPDKEKRKERLMTGITLSVADEDVEYVKVRLSNLAHELAIEVGEKPGDHVYQLGIQFFPLARTDKTSK